MLSSGATCSGCDVVPEVDEENVKVNQWMMPASIKYTQATISSAFSRRLFRPGINGENPRGMSYADRLKAMPILTVRDTLRQLESGELKVEQIPPIRVCEHRAQWYSLDNRRLWVFKQYGRLIPVIIEEPSKEFFQKLDSGELNGETVVILEPHQMAAVMKKKSSTFSSVVLNWSIENVTNNNLYINKVRPVPMKFPDLKEYFEALNRPLLEDTRAKVQQSLEDIGSKPYVRLEFIEEKSKDNEMLQFKTFALRIGGRGSIVQRSKADGPWAPKKSDLVLLTTVVPERVEDFGRYGELYSVAQVIKSNDDEEATQDDMPFAVTAKALMHNESPEYRAICDENSKKDWYLVFLESLVTGMRIWEALADLASEDATREVANEILLSEDVQEFASGCEAEVAPDLRVAVENYCNSRELNSSQTEAALAEFMSLTTGMSRRVSLIQGPPGTGKTKTTTTIVSIAASLKDRVLVSAPTNRAISEVAERFLLLMEDVPSNTSFSDFITTTTSLGGMHLSRNLQVGDVLMVGNEERLDTDGILGRIFLGSRVERLKLALSACGGWNPTRSEMLHFLKGGLGNFRMQEELRAENQTGEAGDFLQFTRNLLNRMGKDLLVSGRTLCNDLPTKLLGRRSANRLATRLPNPGDRQNIRDCCDLTQRLLEAVAKDSLLEKDLLQCFDEAGPQCALRGHGSIEASTFCSARRALLEQISRTPVCEVPPADLENLCLRNAGLVFCTTSSAGSWRVKYSGSFNYAIVDEAAQVVEAETAIILRVPGLERLLLVGDPKQLQALVVSQIAKDSGYGRSLFERLQASGYMCHLLNEQYRMHPAISYFPNRHFYRGAVLDGANVTSEKYRKSYQDFYGPYAFINVGDGVEEREEASQSWKNTMEAEVVRHLVVKIRATVAADENQQSDIGVISPYRGQVEFLQKRLLGCGITCLDTGAPDQLRNADIAVKTVDGFQGGERDVIIFSAVRANFSGNIGFVEEPRRLNVAMTRGRFCVWIVGNARTLEMENELWRTLIQDAKERGCFWNATDDPKIRKLVIRVKSEKKEFDSLLRSDSVLFQNLIWQVYFSKEFKDSITKMKSTQNRQKVISSVVNLAKGRRPPYATECASAANEMYSKFIHQQRTGESVLVWTVDVLRTNPVKQVIRVWDVVNPSFVVGLVRRLQTGFSMYSEPYLQRCATKKLHATDKKVFVPAAWKVDSSFAWFKLLPTPAAPQSEREPEDGQESREHLEKSTVEESMLIMKFYSLTARTACQLIKAVDGSKLEFLLEVSEEQAAVVADPNTNFILGRSGTGKTTIITTRLILKEAALRSSTADSLHASSLLGEADGKMANSVAFDLMPKSGTKDACLRQIVVTLSPKLCTAIKNYIAKASRTSFADEDLGESPDGKQREMMLDDDEDSKLMELIPDTLIDITSEVFPLVVTFRKFLDMINGSVVCPFITEKRSRGGGSASFGFSQVNQVQPSCPTDRDCAFAEEADNGDFQSADEGNESDASLFSDDSDDDEDFIDEDPTGEGADGLEDVASMIEVTFEHFHACYWPRFRAKLVKSFDSSAVFTEILSSIKGSVESLDSAKGRLTEECYVSMACRRASSFDEQQRKSIYSIFLRYEKLKSVRREYDIADYCTHIYRQFESKKYLGEKFHFIYVDEVQDFTMAQIVLFKYVCLDVQRGLVFAGDTAQTIARGVNFRFEDIRRLYYTKFLGRGSRQSAPSEGAAQQSQACSSGKARSNFASENPTNMGELHQLSHNFRTHIGIVEMANSIVQLLYRFFPNAVDKLDAESSSILGDKPTFLERLDNSDFITSLFGNGWAGNCDFGAEQVIIVRNTEAKHRLIERLGKQALVMTVLECKGLEFQDVLSYNFFTDSKFENKWRVIYSILLEACQSMTSSGKVVSFPSFNEQKHHLLMSELKQLYVVVTRARQRLWFYEDSLESHQPMLDYWKSSGLIEVKSPDAELLSTMHVKSTPEEWKRRAAEFFKNKNYDMAELSFERAGDLHLAKYAKAFGIQAAGERSQLSDPGAAGRHFREAATMFIALDKFDLGAKCYLKLGDHRTAGTIYRDKCNPPQPNDAATCFFKGKLWREAAQICRSFSLELCLVACWHGKFLELGLDVLDEWEVRYSTKSSSVDDGKAGDVSPDRTAGDLKPKEGFEVLKMNFLKKCALLYHKQKDVDMMMKFVRRFSSTTLRKTFLRRRDYFDLVMEAEEGDNNFLKAAEMAEEKGDLNHACVLLFRGGYHELVLNKILPHARFEMLWSDGKVGWPLVMTAESRGFLNLASLVARKYADSAPNELVQEIELLLESEKGVSDNWDRFKNSTNIRLQIISGRQAIESSVAFYEDMLSGPHSIDEIWNGPASHLSSVWKAWSAVLISLIQSNSRAKRGRGNLEDERFLECSNSYLGVAEHRQPNSFLVPDSRAVWIKDSKVMPNQGRKCQVKSEDVFQRAEEFWVLQLYQVGSKVIKVLEKLLFPAREQSLQVVDSKTSASEWLQWKRQQICDLYLTAQCLAENSTSSLVQTEEPFNLASKLRQYGLRICDMSFPSSYNAQDVKSLLCFRHELQSNNVYDSVATHLLPNSPAERQTMWDVQQDIGRIHVLFPFLSRQWFRKHERSPQTIASRNIWFEPWNLSNYIYGTLAERDRQPCPQDTCYYWLMRVEDYCWFLLTVHDKQRKSIHPFTLMHLLERGIVMEFAIHSRLESCLLPESFVVNHMTGDNDKEMYSWILNLQCRQYCRRIDRVEPTLGYILDCLNFTYGQFEWWFDEVGVDWRSHLPSFILRLVAVVFTICLNSTRDVSGKAIKALRSFFQSGSPLLQGLKQEFKKELSRVMFGMNFPLESDWRAAITKAFEAIGNPLIAVRYKEVPRWAHKLQIRKMRICSRVDGRRYFRTDYQTIVEEHIRKLNKSDWDHGFPEASTDVQYGQADDAEETEDLGEWDMGQDCRTSDELPGDSSDKSALIPIWSVSFGEGQTFSFIMKFRLLKCLEKARKRLNAELTPAEKYKREAVTFFKKWNVMGTEYADRFLSEACPLKIQADSLLQELETCLQTLKADALENMADSDEMLDKIADVQDELQAEVAMLDPRKEQHKSGNLICLAETLAKVKSLVERGVRISRPVTEYHTSRQQPQELQVDEEEAEVTGSTVQDKKSGKKRVKNKNKKKRRK